MPDPRLLRRYADGYEAVENALDGITPAELDRRPAPGCWTAREVVHHLADSETRSYLRLRTLLVGSPDPHGSPLIEPYDEEAWTAEPRLAYGTRAIEPSLAVLRAVREASFELVRALPAADLQLAGRHPDHDEPYTVQLWLQLYADHPHDHADQIARARRGEP